MSAGQAELLSPPDWALASGWALVALAVTFSAGGQGAFGVAVAACLLLGTLAAGAALVLAGRLQPPRAGGLAWIAVGCLAAWAGVALLSITWSLAPDSSWLDGVRGLVACAALIAGIWLGTLMRRPTETLAGALCALSLPVLGWAVVQRSFGRFEEGGSSARLRAPLEYANALGVFCALVAPAALYVATSRGRRRRAAGTAALALAVFALGPTGSRGGVLALVVALALWLALVPRRAETVAVLAAALAPALPATVWALSRPQFASFDHPPPAVGPSLLAVAVAVCASAALLGVLALGAVDRLGARGRRRLALAAAVAGAAAALALVGAFAARHGGPVGAASALWHGLAGGGISSDPQTHFTQISGNERGRWWHQAWHAFERSPWYGWGAGSFAIVNALLRAPDAQISVEPHSAAMQVLSGLGLAGALPALGALLATAAAVGQGVARLSGGARAAAAALAAGVAALALHSQIDFDWRVSALTVIAFPLCGAVAAAGLGPAPVRERTPTDVRALAGIAIALAAVALVVAVLPELGARAQARACSDALAGHADQALVQADLAHALDPLSPTTLELRAAALATLGRIGASQRDMRAAALLEPGSYAVWQAQAGLQRGAWGDPAGARRSLRTANRLYRQKVPLRNDGPPTCGL